MKFLDEFRDSGAARRLLDAIHAVTTRPWTLMEVCGGQTHSLIRNGIDGLLPDGVTCIHGPGCPVCVTPLELIDKAISLAARPGVTFCSFGDMLRVPGSSQTLLQVRAEGGDVRVVYSPLDAVRIAREEPEREVVFFGVGFETTAPTTALAALQARALNLHNFSLLTAHVRVPPAIEAILDAPANRVQAFLAAGHVCTVAGYQEYEPIVRRHRVPIVVTGFEPVDLLAGLLSAIRQLEDDRAEVENAYARSVRPGGNTQAMAVVREVYQVSDRQWRGLGVLPQGGFRIRPEFVEFDAETRFSLGSFEAVEPSECRSAEVLQGLLRPQDCPAFGVKCTPAHPLGAPMVSNEGACSAYWGSGRRQRLPLVE